jgi:hypothetical protein
MPAVDKRALIAALREDIERSIAANTRAANEAREAATHEESKPENDKDTRALEAGYLAGAQADRARELARVSAALAALPLKRFTEEDVISASALVELDHAGATQLYFLAPQGGGMRVRVEGVEVLVITPPSPLGRELLGKSAGDTIEVRAQGTMRRYEIVTVA